MKNQDKTSDPSEEAKTTPHPPNYANPQQEPYTQAKQHGTAQGTANTTDLSRELHWLEKLNIVGQISLVIVGIIAAGIYGCQLREMRQTNDLTKQALTDSDNTLMKTLTKMQAQVDAADSLYREAQKQTVQSEEIVKNSAIQARVAREAVETAKRSLIVTAHSERAWIGLADARLVSFAPNTPLQYEIVLVNSGRTPALGVRSAISVVWLNSTRSDASKLVELEKARHWLQFIPDESIPPGQVSTISASSYIGSVNSGLTSQGVNTVLTGKASIYLPGRVEFVDIYQRPQWVEFCMYITSVAGKAVIQSCPLQQSKMSYQREKE